PATFEIRSRIGCILLLVQRAIKGSLIRAFSSVVSAGQLSSFCKEMHWICQEFSHCHLPVITSICDLSPLFRDYCFVEISGQIVALTRRRKRNGDPDRP